MSCSMKSIVSKQHTLFELLFNCTFYVLLYASVAHLLMYLSGPSTHVPIWPIYSCAYLAYLAYLLMYLYQDYLLLYRLGLSALLL